MALTGSQKAYTFALSNVARSGATRSGYVSGGVFISVGGVPLVPLVPGMHTGVALDSLVIRDQLDEAPNTCTFRTINAVPATGQPVVVTLGSTNGARLFAGHVLTIEEGIGGKPDQVRADVSCVDYSWLLGFQKVTKRYAGQTATAIATDLIASYAAVNGFTATNVQAFLPTLDEITFTNEDLPDALTRLARRIGAYWYVDYQKDLHLFIDEVVSSPPRGLTPTHPTLALEGFSYQADRTQALTRVYVEGRGSRVLGAVAAGDTIIPLEAADMFAAASDVFAKVSFQGADGAAQHLNFSGVVNTPGVGSLVGPGNGPPGAPTAALAAGAGLSTGAYAYAYTDVTPSGESLPSPLGSVTTGVVQAPASAPVPGVPTTGAGPDAGAHQYAASFTTATGETTPSVLSSVVTTGSPSIANPTAAATGFTPDDNNFANLVENGLYQVKYAYSTQLSAPSVHTSCTLASPPSASIRANTSGGGANNAAIACAIPCSADPAVKRVLVYRTTNGGSTFYYASLAVNTPGAFVNHAGTPSDAQIASDNIRESGSNTTPPRSVVPLTAIPLGDPAVTGRKLYRTAAGGTQLKLLATLADNTTTTYTDTLADAALGANAPTSNTAAAARVSVSTIAAGPTPTTSRKLYRTVVNGAQLKLLTTLADNTTTTYLDAIADGSLGANAPTGDTSALQVPAGSVPAGSTSLIAANVGVFPTAGWAIIGNGEQVIRYTAKSATALTGIPAAGIGAIKAAVAYNSTVTIAPMLTGIPATGTRALARALAAGDEIYLVVQVDDTTRQSNLAAAVGGNGIREEWVQDRRLSIAEARARGQATLNVRTLDQVTLSYRCRDIQTAAGRTIFAIFPSPININANFKIQAVTIDHFRPYPTQYPTYTVEASSARFSFEDWLRNLRTKD